MIAVMLMLATGTAACSPDDSPPTSNIPAQPAEPGGGNSGGNNDTANPGENNDNMTLTIKTGTATFTATLADNATAKAFKGMLPMTVDMNELNRNEKYCNLPQSLPTAASNPVTIRSGDIMLFGPGTLVLFYKTFATSYSYTKIGRIDNPSALENALGAGNVTVTFETFSE